MSCRALLLCALALGGLACAATPLVPLDIEQPQTPGPEEGFLLLETESTHIIESLRVERVDASGRHQVEGLPEGRTVHLTALPAGEYRWAEVEARVKLPPLPKGMRYRHGAEYVTWKLPDESDMRFTVEAGRTNYAGVLLLIRFRYDTMLITTVNRSGELIDTLRAEYPWILTDLPLGYTGRLRADFLATYQAA